MAQETFCRKYSHELFDKTFDEVCKIHSIKQDLDAIKKAVPPWQKRNFTDALKKNLDTLCFDYYKSIFPTMTIIPLSLVIRAKFDDALYKSYADVMVRSCDREGSDGHCAAYKQAWDDAFVRAERLARDDSISRQLEEAMKKVPLPKFFDQS